MKIKLGKITFYIFIAFYFAIALYFKFYIEPLFNGHFFVSIFVGLASLLIIWALVKIKILNTSWFRLYKTK